MNLNFVTYLFLYVSFLNTSTNGGPIKFLATLLDKRKSKSKHHAKPSTSEFNALSEKVSYLTSQIQTLQGENEVFREDIINYKKIIMTQKRVNLAAKTELLNLQIKLNEIEVVHKTEIGNTRAALQSEVNNEIGKIEASIRQQSEEETKSIVAQLSLSKAEEIDHIKKQLQNEMKSILDKEAIEKNKLRKQLADEKEKSKKFKAASEKTIESTQEKHKNVSLYVIIL